MRRNLPPLKTLPIFSAVARHLSFTRAAHELSLTHSAVSQAIKQLEEYLGCKLFERSTTNVLLTKIEQRYLIDIAASLDQIHNATTYVKHATQRLNINLMSSLALHWLIPSLPNFQNAHQDLKVNLSTTALPLFSSLDQHDIDVVIACRSIPIQGEQYYCIELFADELVLVASPKLIGNSKSKVSIPLLLKQSNAIYVDAPLRKSDWQKWCKNNKMKEPPKNLRYSFPSTSQAIQATISGAGILVTHKAFVGDNLNYGLLTIADNSTVRTKQRYYIVVLNERVEEPKIKAFIAFLQAIKG